MCFYFRFYANEVVLSISLDKCTLARAWRRWLEKSYQDVRLLQMPLIGQFLTTIIVYKYEARPGLTITKFTQY